MGNLYKYNHAKTFYNSSEKRYGLAKALMLILATTALLAALLLGTVETIW